MGSTNPIHRPDAAALLSAIGHTPLVEIPFVTEVAPHTRLFAKLESVNPGGSIKDRPVARMLTRAIEKGRLGKGRHLLDSSSGNAGIAYAQLGAALGIPVTVVVPGNASAERLARIRAHGAELFVTDAVEGYDHALREAARLADEFPDRYWYCNQYANADNWRSHFDGTGAEILTQVAARTGATPDCLVAGVGTGGTLTGVGRRLREVNGRVRIVAAVPESFPGIEGLKPIGTRRDIVPPLLDESLIDERVSVGVDEAIAMCRRLARLGLFVGPSSGAFVHVALAIAARDQPHCMVTVLSDTGERYVSVGMWEQSDDCRPADEP